MRKKDKEKLGTKKVQIKSLNLCAMHCQYMCSKLKTKIKLLMSYN